MRIRTHIAALAFGATYVYAAPPQQPSGWRAPTTSELSASGETWRDESPSKYQSAQGDFDGDGKRDEAVLLVSSGGKEFAVFFHSSGGSWKLLTRSPVVSLQSMGLSVVAPGKHATACGKGYWECKKGEPKELSLSNEAILFFAEESASSAFVWSRANQKFEQVWLSD